MLAWWDEPPELLEQAVLSMEGFADQLVAADGGYSLWAGATAKSDPEQKQAIVRAAKQAGIVVSFLRPRLWVGQVQKRNALLQTEAAKTSDWVMPFDADWVLRGEKRQARLELEASKAEMFTLMFRTPADPARSLDVTSSTDWHRETVDIAAPMGLLYRVYPHMRMVRHHWWYSGLRPDGVWVTYLGGGGSVAARDEAFKSEVWIEHLCHFRDLFRIGRNREFCYARDRQVSETGVEA